MENVDDFQCRSSLHGWCTKWYTKHTSWSILFVKKIAYVHFRSRFTYTPWKNAKMVKTVKQKRRNTNPVLAKGVFGYPLASMVPSTHVWCELRENAWTHSTILEDEQLAWRRLNALTNTQRGQQRKTTFYIKIAHYLARKPHWSTKRGLFSKRRSRPAWNCSPFDVPRRKNSCGRQYRLCTIQVDLKEVTCDPCKRGIQHVCVEHLIYSAYIKDSEDAPEMSRKDGGKQDSGALPRTVRAPGRHKHGAIFTHLKKRYYGTLKWTTKGWKTLNSFKNIRFGILGADYMSPTGRASPTIGEIPRAIWNHIKKRFRLHERRAGPLSRAEKNRLIRIKNSAFEVFFRSRYVALE